MGQRKKQRDIGRKGTEKHEETKEIEGFRLHTVRKTRQAIQWPRIDMCVHLACKHVGGAGRRRGVLIALYGVESWPLISHAYHAGTEHPRFSGRTGGVVFVEPRQRQVRKKLNKKKWQATDTAGRCLAT